MMRIELPSPPKRILIVKPSALGDVIHALPVLNLLRRRWPDARISWLVGSAYAEILQGHPQLDEVILFDRARYGQSWRNPRAVMELVRFLRGLGRREFDLVIDLQGLLRSGWLSGLTRAPVRVGFANAREMAHLFYTHRVDVGSMEQHAVDRCLGISEALGCGREPVEFRLAAGPEDRGYIDELVRGIGPFAVLLPAATWATKRWPVERFAALAQALRERFGLASVVAGGADAAPLAAQIPSALDAVGKTSLKQLVALLDRAKLVIANDSGPMHIAAALGRPLVAIFGPTNPARTGPYRRPDSVARVEISCSPCYGRKCGHRSCMKWLEVEAVLSIAQRQLRRIGADDQASIAAKAPTATSS